MKTRIEVEQQTQDNINIASKINSDIKVGDFTDINTVLEIAKRHTHNTSLYCGRGGHHVWISRDTIMQEKQRQIIIYFE